MAATLTAAGPAASGTWGHTHFSNSSQKNKAVIFTSQFSLTALDIKIHDCYRRKNKTSIQNYIKCDTTIHVLSQTLAYGTYECCPIYLHTGLTSVVPDTYIRDLRVLSQTLAYGTYECCPRHLHTGLTTVVPDTCIRDLRVLSQTLAYGTRELSQTLAYGNSKKKARMGEGDSGRITFHSAPFSV